MSPKQIQNNDHVYLENTQNTSNKFFHIHLKQKTITKQYGKINNKGQTLKHIYSSVEKAKEAFHHILQEKLKKGYVKVSPQRKNTKPNAHLPSKRNTSRTMTTHTRKRSKRSSATTVSKMIQDVQTIFDQDVQSGPVFQSQDGWTPELLERARESIPSYVNDYPDTAKDSPGNIVEMIWEDFEPSLNHHRNGPIIYDSWKDGSDVYRDTKGYYILQWNPKTKKEYKKYLAKTWKPALNTPNKQKKKKKLKSKSFV